MLCGRYQGNPIHRFIFGPHQFFLTRGSTFVAAKWGNTIAVMVPPGMSYQQATREAERAIHNGNFFPEREKEHCQGKER